MSEYVLKKEYDEFKDEVKNRFHMNDLDKAKMKGRLNSVDEDVKEILDSQKWMKRMWMKAIVTMVCSVSGSAFIGLFVWIWKILNS